ncbi:MAG: ester cyclase [Acetobacteraceae bacterium]|nr:ester cyclase [Acetobacteraceae bacterium]
MSVEANKIAARRFVVEALDGGSAAALEELFHLGAVRHFPPRDIRVEPAPTAAPPRDRSQHTDIHHLYGEGDFVTIHLTHHVTFQRGAQFLTRMGSVDVGGKDIVWNAMVVLRFDGDKIAEEWVVRDELMVLLQVGAVKPRDGAPVPRVTS